MIDKTKIDQTVQEVADLKDLFTKIQADTEELLRRGKALSDAGAHEAQELIETVRTNWQGLLKTFAAGGIATMLNNVGKQSPDAAPKLVEEKAAKKNAKPSKPQAAPSGH